MIKLYKRTNGRVTEYHEAWVRDSTVVVEHWGRLGTEGSERDHPVDPELSKDENIRRVLGPAISGGFAPIDSDEHSVLLIEFAVDGFGTDADFDKRHELEVRMGETLGWTGLGHCDGGSSGSGTMEVCCYVVDFEIAKQVVEDDLAGTEFAGYSRIYEEGSQ